jgi:hypothetical protein
MRPILGYIDPGTGAMVWQSLTAVVIGASFYFRRILLKLRKR